MTDKKLKHLEFIQLTIGRMAGNLFLLRGWVITLLAGILVLLTKIGDGRLPITFLMLMIVLFWMYDGYFLSMEKMYRDLYDKVRVMKEEEIDFSMDIEEFKKYKKNSIIYCIFRPTLKYFYGSLFFATLYVLIFMK